MRVINFVGALIIAVTIGLGAGVTAPRVDAGQNRCQAWAEQYNRARFHAASEDAELNYVMHVRGCHKPYNVWKPATYSRCMGIAYGYASRGVSIAQIITLTRSRGCFLHEDGSWGDR